MNSHVTMHPFPRPLPEAASVFGGTQAEKTYAAGSHSYGLDAGLSITKPQPTKSQLTAWQVRNSNPKR